MWFKYVYVNVVNFLIFSLYHIKEVIYVNAIFRNSQKHTSYWQVQSGNSTDTKYHHIWEWKVKRVDQSLECLAVALSRP